MSNVPEGWEERVSRSTHNEKKYFASNSSSQTVVDELLSKYSCMKVKNPVKVETILQGLFSGGFSKLQLLVDFDYTLTRVHKNGKSVDSSWGVLENSPFLPSDYNKKCNALKDRYLPIEHDPNLSVKDKIPHMIEWYMEANKMVQQCGIHKGMLVEMVKASNVEFREGTQEMLTQLAKVQVPVLILSAGLGDLVEEILRSQHCYHSNIKVVSNFLDFDQDGKVLGLKGQVIHVFNKNEDAIHDSEYFKNIQTRHNVMLMGDSLGDLSMSEGITYAENMLTIGFLNKNIEANLDKYLESFDIVLVEDQTMDVLRYILSLINP